MPGKSDAKFDRDCICHSPDLPGRAAARPRKIEGLADASLLALKHDTFKVPSSSEIRKIKPGDHVKISRNHERFWVRVDGYVGKKWHGTVSNKLVMNDDLKEGESIFFMRKNIYDSMRR